jgi:Ca-activated chloride channel homolog
MRRSTLAIVLSAWCAAAWADAFNDEVRRGNALLRIGDPGAASAVYRDLQIEEPESDLLYYGMACADYETAMTKFAEQANDEAVEALNRAKDGFERASISTDGEIRTGARYNLANCLAQEAKQLAGAGDHQATVDAFKASVDAYEQFLESHPDHEGARQNLEHMRYLLKKMLQNPPQEQEQDQQGENEDQSEDQQDGEDQQNQEGPQDEQKEQPQEQSEQEQQDQGEDEQQQQPESSAQDQAEQNEQPEDQQSQEPQDRQSVEAILQSLEDMDKREQKDTRRPQSVEVGREWW